MSDRGPTETVPGPVLALDLGDRRIGVAVSDRRRILARPLAVLERHGDTSLDHAAIVRLVEESGATTVVVGLPLMLSGATGAAAKRALAEMEELRSVLAVPVEGHDERLSTIEATRRAVALRAERRGPRAKAPRRRAVVDDRAAAVILESYLARSEQPGAEQPRAEQPRAEPQ